MKKIGMGIFGIITMIMLITTCGGTPKAAVSDELDTAIREVSDYLNDNIPAGSKLVILNVQSNSTDLSNYIIDELIANTVNDRIFSVVDRAQLDVIRAEQNFQFSGEVDDNMALEVGKFFGAQTIVSGTVSMLGSRYRLTFRALEVQTAQVQGQFNRNINTSEIVTALMKSGGGTATTASGARTQTTSGGTTATPTQTAQPTAPAATAQPATPTQPARPANGTYTFWPRPRAKKAGIPLNGYLNKVVVDGRYMIFYILDVERGPSAWPTIGWNDGSTLLTNLNRPSQTWRLVGFRHGSENNGEGFSLSFEGVTVTRFSLECQFGGLIIFDEINLADADYEP